MRRTLTSHFSAWLPLAMSLAAFALLLVHVARFGITQEPDEGTAARAFQLLMAAQLPVVVFFAIKWLPRTPRQAVQVLALQVGAALAAFAAVIILESMA